jgi:hypothetical protein
MLKIGLVILVLGVIGAFFVFSQNSNKAETTKSIDSSVISFPQNDKERKARKTMSHLLNSKV